MLLDAIQKDGLHGVTEIGTALQACTNCGSCWLELQALLGKSDKSAAA